ncbi:MAG: hypothetical protein HFI76_06045 [Lachnospiraceae bacterium]|nr:hypothetical protein [Lachnospiraceae bacterium]
MLVGGVFLAVKAYDTLTVSVKEQKEKMEDSMSAYKDAKSELSNIITELENQEQAMNDLLTKENLTYAEQGQLEELQAITRELRIQKDLAEKEEGRAQKEVAKDASDLFNKQFGKYDISENAISKYENIDSISNLALDNNDISAVIAGYNKANESLEKAYASKNQEGIDYFKSLTENFKDSIFETAQELQEQQSNIADYYNTIKGISYDDLTNEQKGIVDSYHSISDAIELIYQQLDPNTWKSMQIENVFDTEGIEKTKEELLEMVKAGEFDENTLQSYPKLSAALEQNKVSASELRNELKALAEAEANVKGDPISFSSRFKNLWDSEIFSSARSDLISLSKEAGITGNDILSLAMENGALAALLKDSGISAQFAASCFNRVCNGADGFSAITEDALALDKVLHGMDESLESVSQAKSKYDKAISGDDYNTEFKNYQDAYQSAMEMFENGEYGKHFSSAMEYLLGDDSYTMGIDEMYEAMKNLESVFGENGDNGLGFLDRLYSKKDVLEGLGSSLEQLSDGTYNYDLNPDDFEAIGEAVGMTAEEVAACTNALGMFGNHVSYDIGELETTLKGMSISAKDGKDAFLSLQGMESMLSSLGYTGEDIYHIMEQIKDMGSLNLIDFSKDDEESLNEIVSQLKELDMLELDGKNINVDSLIENLASSFHMTSDDITSFLSSLGENYNFTDNSGNDVSQAEAADKVQQPELYRTKEAADSTAESVDAVSTAVDLLNNKKLIGINEEFGALKGAVSAVADEVGLLSGKVDELARKTASVSFGGIQYVQEATSRVLGTNTGNTGSKSGSNTGGRPGNKTGKQNPQGMAKAAGTGNIGIKKTETALINELGHETIIDPKKGTYEIVQGGAQFRELKKGQIVLNHKQTEGLLRNGKIATFGKMLFRGNANLEGSSYAVGTASSRNPATGRQWTDNGNPADSSGNPGTDSPSTDNDTQASTEIFSFIETAVSRIEDAIRRLKGKAEETFRSFTSRGKAYTDTIKKTTDEIKLQQQAYDKYKEKADSIGLDEYYASQVRDGSINMEYIEDDNLKEQIRSYQEWYEKAYECLQTMEELKKTQQELAREKIELSITKYDQKLSHAQANARGIQDYVDLKEAYGGHASDKQYKGMNKYAKEQIDYTIKQNHSLKELQKTVTKGSEAWYEYQRQIDSNLFRQARTLPSAYLN